MPVTVVAAHLESILTVARPIFAKIFKMFECGQDRDGVSGADDSVQICSRIKTCNTILLLSSGALRCKPGVRVSADQDAHRGLEGNRALLSGGTTGYLCVAKPMPPLARSGTEQSELLDRVLKRWQILYAASQPQSPHHRLAKLISKDTQ